MPIDYVTGDDHVVTITINRPEARNSLDMEHFFQLRSAWDRFGEDDDAYVAIVTGVGKDFCVGADLKTYIPQITELQSKMKDGARPEELGGYRLDDGVRAVLRGGCGAKTSTSRSSPPSMARAWPEEWRFSAAPTCGSLPTRPPSPSW